MNDKKVSKNVLENILITVCIIIYFALISLAYYKLSKNNLLMSLKILSMIVLAMGIIILEVAYRKGSKKRTINAIEIFILAGYTLSIAYMVEAQKLNFIGYILVSLCIFSIYYLLKAIFIYTKEKKDYLNSLSDIKEIVTNDPVKKVATKKINKF